MSCYPQENTFFCELREYQEDISNADILILTTSISIRKSCDPQKNTFYMD